MLLHTASGGGYAGVEAELEVTVRDHTSPVSETPPPVVSFVSASSNAPETAGTRNVTVDLSLAPTAAITLRYSVGGTATAGSDYTIANTGSVSVSSGAASVTIPVGIVDDALDEGDETVVLTLTAASGYTVGSPDRHTLTIADDDDEEEPPPLPPPPPPAPVAAFATGASTASENAGTRNIQVNFSPAPASAIVLRYGVGGTATAGSDFTIANSGSVTVSTGAASVTIPVGIVDDALDESDETVVLTLIAASGYTVGSPNSHTLTIADDDVEEPPPPPPPPPAPVASFATGASTASENAGTRNILVNFSPAPASAITLRYGVGGTATAGSDFTIANSGSVSVSSGATSVTIPVAIVDDALDEDDETVVLTLTAATGYSVGSPDRHTLTIADDDEEEPPPPPSAPVASFATVASTASENPGTGDILVNFSPAPATAITLRYGVGGTATAGSDFTIANTGTVSVSAGATSVTIPVAIVDDAHAENDETVVLTLTDATGYSVGSPDRHTLSIADDDEEEPPPPPAPVASFSAAKSSAGENAGVHTVTVNLSPVPGADITLAYTAAGSATAEEDYAALSGTLDVPAGDASADITVTIVDDGVDEADEADETLVLTLVEGNGYALGTTTTHTLVIMDDDDPLPPDWLVRYGRTVAQAALDGVGLRITAERTPGFEGALAGQAMNFSSSGGTGAPAAGAAGAMPVESEVALTLADIARGLDPGAGSGAVSGRGDFGTGFDAPQGQLRSMSAREALLGSSLAVTGQSDGTGGSLALWGHASASAFDGGEGTLALDGVVTTAMLGADYARERWLAGLVLMRSTGGGGWDGADAGGEAEATLTSVIPYAALQAAERFKLWGAARPRHGRDDADPAPGRYGQHRRTPTGDEGGHRLDDGRGGLARRGARTPVRGHRPGARGHLGRHVGRAPPRRRQPGSRTPKAT